MKLILPFLVFLFLSQPAHTRQQSDTLQAVLGEVEVTAYESNRRLMEVPASVSFVNADLVSAFDASSMLFSFNTIPGLRMEQRAPGSYRIAIRGSSLRSPFGIRNVKIYWNGIPFTEPSGNSFLNLLDVQNMQHAEVIRGPAGSVYGAGNGGVILFDSFQNEEHLEAGLSLGSYNYQRQFIHADKNFENGLLNFSYARQLSDGYREQSFLNRKTAELSGKFNLNAKQFIQTSFLFSDLNYGIPGPLTQEQMQENHRQARPGNAIALGSAEANASILHQAFLAGVSHNWNITPGIANEVSLFGSFSHFDHPFNLDYKLDSRKSGGLRNIISMKGSFGLIKSQLTAGIEYHASEYAARNYENAMGSPGALNFDDQISIESALAFLSVELELPADFFLSAGLSLNRLHYSLNRLESNLPEDSEGLAQKNFDPEFIPRLGIVKKFSSALSLFGNIGFGFSPPTIEEFRTNEGSINMNLEAEEGLNYELGIRGYLKDGRFQYDITGFYFQLDESIVQQQSERGTVLFENAGNTNQYGLELSSKWSPVYRNNGLIRDLNMQFSYTFNHFRFGDYNREGMDFSENELTGVAPHTAAGILQLIMNTGFYSTLSINFTDQIPLNDANSVYSEEYFLVQGKIGYRYGFNDALHVDIFAGVDNLLNEKYSLGNDLNAFGGRYYQPAAPRNWFGGFTFTHDI